MIPKPYTATCPDCGQPYVEEAYISPDDPDRCCPKCCVKANGYFEAKWFVRNPCPYPIGSEEQKQITSARADLMLPIKVEGDNEEYNRKQAKGVVSKRRSSRSELTPRSTQRTGAIRLEPKGLEDTDG